MAVIFKSELSFKQYKFCCELIWGVIPIDREWAEGTKLFQSESKIILEKYPKLDSSFFEMRTKS